MTEYKKEEGKVLRLHPELSKYRKKRLLKLYLKMLISGATILALTVFLYCQTPQIAIAVIGGLFALVGVYKIADPRKNFTKKCGKITKISLVQKRVNNKNGMQFSYTAMMDAVVLVVSIETPGGRRYEIELSDQYQPCIKEGDVLLRIPGVPYFIIPNPQEMVVCPYCGNIMPRENTNCVGCGQENIYVKN